MVIATGRTRVPVVPTWPGRERYRGDVLRSSADANGQPWAGRAVLVVGFGSSACEQALDLVVDGAEAHLAVRSPVNVVPRDVFGRIPVLHLAMLLAHRPPAVADVLAWPVVRAVVGDVTDVGLPRRLPYGPITQITGDQRVPLLDIGTLRAIRDGRIAVHGEVARVTDDGADFPVGWEAVCDADGTPRRLRRADGRRRPVVLRGADRPDGHVPRDRPRRAPDRRGHRRVVNRSAEPGPQATPVRCSVMAAKAPAVEVEVGGRTVRISNPDRVYFEATGATKLDLVRYYEAVGPGIVNALRERPCMLHRFPTGVGGEKVHQKRVPAGAPPWLETVRVHFPRYGQHADELCVTELAQVIWAVQMSTVEFHPWNSRRADVERPDEWRIDLDPMPECPLSRVRRVAGVVHEVLDEIGAVGWPKTSWWQGDPRLRPHPCRPTGSRTCAAPPSPSPGRSSGGRPAT